MFIFVILFYLILGFYELVPLYQSKKWRDLVSNTVLMVVSFAIAILLSVGVELPSPEAPIRTVITSVFGK